MKKNERVFLAIGGADEELLRRCEASKRRRLWPGVLAAAACLALILAALLPRLANPAAPAPPDDGNPLQPVDVTPPVDDTVIFTPQSSDAVFHLLCLAEASAESAPGFTIYVNEERFSLSEEGGEWVVRPKEPVDIPGVELPPCELRITRYPGLALEEAQTRLSEAWRERYPELSDWEHSPLTGGPMLCGWDGLAWDAAYIKAYLFEDGQGGVYALAYTCFMEAVEGAGQRFTDMIRTFRPMQAGVPAWLVELEAASRRLTRAILMDDLTGVRELLADGAVIDGYGRDVSDHASVTAFDYTVDDVQTPARAVVSVQCREDIEEAYDYLTIEMQYQDGRWTATNAGVEK